jgi:hypothetical protein
MAICGGVEKTDEQFLQVTIGEEVESEVRGMDRKFLVRGEKIRKSDLEENSEKKDQLISRSWKVKRLAV